MSNYTQQTRILLHLDIVTLIEAKSICNQCLNFHVLMSNCTSVARHPKILMTMFLMYYGNIQYDFK